MTLRRLVRILDALHGRLGRVISVLEAFDVVAEPPRPGCLCASLPRAASGSRSYRLCVACSRARTERPS